ncbi:hypothetical protein J6590_025588 [Homalodisca vitripennis]|nr:hypothetical protein J6590_025588 [Homalodisca vitripennis]
MSRADGGGAVASRRCAQAQGRRHLTTRGPPAVSVRAPRRNVTVWLRRPRLEDGQTVEAAAPWRRPPPPATPQPHPEEMRELRHLGARRGHLHYRLHVEKAITAARNRLRLAALTARSELPA